MHQEKQGEEKNNLFFRRVWEGEGGGGKRGGASYMKGTCNTIPSHIRVAKKSLYAIGAVSPSSLGMMAVGLSIPQERGFYVQYGSLPVHIKKG